MASSYTAASELLSTTSRASIDWAGRTILADYDPNNLITDDGTGKCSALPDSSGTGDANKNAAFTGSAGSRPIIVVSDVAFGGWRTIVGDITYRTPNWASPLVAPYTAVYVCMSNNSQTGNYEPIVSGNNNTNDSYQLADGALKHEAADWVTSTIYGVGAYVYRSSNIYVCTTEGTSGSGPSGTGTGIADGSCVWSYVQVATPSRRIYSLSQSPAQTTEVMGKNRPRIIIISRGDASNPVQIYIDGVLVTTPNQSNAGAKSLDGVTIGDLSTGGFAFKGTLARCTILSGTTSWAQAKALDASLRQRYRIGMSALNLVCFVGDSITVGPNQIGTRWNLFRNSATAAGYSVFVTHKALSGRTTKNMLDQAATEVDPIIGTAFPRYTLVLCTGTNGPGSGYTADASGQLQAMVDYAVARRAAGWHKVVMGTMLPTSQISEGIRGALNPTIRTNTNWHGVMDYAASSVVGQVGQNVAGAYYSDTTHLTDLGHRVLDGITLSSVAPMLRTSLIEVI